MKKVLFVTNHMNVGGIQKSLLELLRMLAQEEEYEISLFCCKQTGAFLEQLPANIRLLPEDPYARIVEQSAAACKKQGIKFYILRVVLSAWSKWFTKAIPAALICKLIGKLGSYDVAISFSQPIGDRDFCNLTNEIVLQCVDAPRKVTFVHCDFGRYGGNTKRNRALYRRFDRVAAVSNSVGEVIKSHIPEIRDRTVTVYNCCDCQEVLRLSQEDPVQYDTTTFVTVARLSEEKGLLRCVPIFARLRQEGYKFQWHIVGGGPLNNALKEQIRQYEMEGWIVPEGEQVNPHRYVKNADFFLLPSFHEAAPMVFGEASTLGVPVLTTATLSARELVESRGLGLVCENQDDAVYEMLCRALQRQDVFSKEGRPDNRVSVEQFRQVCGDRED